MKLTMPIPFEQARDAVKAHNTSSKVQAEKYEAVECWSYAYLARWVVLEKGLKSLYDLNNKECIRQGVLEWLKYLDGQESKAPKRIKDFSVQTRYIPSQKFITDLLGTCSSIEKALASEGKYRRMRNSIAHKADEFGSERIYRQYKKVMDSAITQFLTKLSRRANINK